MDSLAVADLLNEIAVQPGSIVSKPLSSHPGSKVVLFAFDAGQELSEHTAAVPAIIQVLSGKGRLVLGGEPMPAGPGTWASMAANLPHSVHADEPMIMLLTMLK